MATARPDCVFCKIIEGSVPAHMVLEGPQVVAFLDTRPLFKGHVLVVPRAHHATLGELPRELVGPYFEEVQRVTRAVERGMSADGSFVAANNVVSQSVPHLHVHVVPRRRKDGLRGFFWPRTTYADDSEAAATVTAIKAAL